MYSKKTGLFAIYVFEMERVKSVFVQVIDYYFFRLYRALKSFKNEFDICPNGFTKRGYQK